MPTGFRIPATLKDSLTSRLDKLFPVKQVAQVSSVLGRSFSRSLLASVPEAGPANLDFGLRALVETGVLDHKAGEDPRYSFRHALIRDAAHESMLNSRRAQRHRRAADMPMAARDMAREAGASAILHRITADLGRRAG